MYGFKFKVKNLQGPLHKMKLRLSPRLSAEPEYQSALKQMMHRYITDMRRQFNMNSRGGGRWAPLSTNTTRSRRRGPRPKRQTAILRDTGTLFRALTIGSPGNVLKVSWNRVVFMFKGGKHPADGMTVGRLASIHHEGKGRNLPKRPILTEPSEQTKRGMRGDVDRATKKYIQRTS